MIIIDAGHNKLTSGKRAFDSSFFEYEFNYDVAKRIKQHLIRHGEVTELLQVESANSAEEIYNRVNYINKSGAKLVVSIHANAYGKDWNTANGWEIFCYNMSGESLKLAQEIHKYSIPYLGIKDRGIKDGSEFALVGSTTPTSVLVEHGFYTNKTELALIKSDEFREKCAIADAKGILSYLGIKWVDEVKEEYLYKVQVGSFLKKESAILLQQNLKSKGFDSFIKEETK